MKVVILAGGSGTRISEETGVRPKPMVEVGGRPMLWHIMKIYSQAGLNEFVVCLGYKGGVIKDYFANYFLHASDVTFDIAANRMEFHQGSAESWRVTLVDTGGDTMTGGRLKRVRPYLGEETFCMSYGDGLADLDMKTLIAFHRAEGALATLTAVQPPGRFGAFSLAAGRNRIAQFREKSKEEGAWINGGFFVIEPAALDRVEGDAIIWEREPLERLAQDGELAAYRHDGFWQNMDTLRDRNLLEELWRSGSPPWKIW